MCLLPLPNNYKFKIILKKKKKYLDYIFWKIPEKKNTKGKRKKIIKEIIEESFLDLKIGEFKLKKPTSEYQR